jgi:hypothetical protein
MNKKTSTEKLRWDDFIHKILHKVKHLSVIGCHTSFQVGKVCNTSVTPKSSVRASAVLLMLDVEGYNKCIFCPLVP